MLPLRSAAGLLSDGRLLPEPLPGGAAAPRGGRGPAGVRRGPADRHPGAEEPDDEAHFRRPLRRQGGPPAPHPHTHKGGGNTLSSNNDDDAEVKSNLGKDYFLYAGTTLWNRLPGTLKSVRNIGGFKKAWKQWLRRQS